MAKTTYKYNPDTLTFEKYKLSWQRQVFRVFGFISMSFVFSIAIAALIFYLVPSPREKMLERELSQYELQFKLMNKKLSTFTNVLDELATRDKYLYRVIFEAEPIPLSVWEGGTGGVEKNINFDMYSKGDLLKSLYEKVDKVSKKLVIQSESYDEIANLAANKEDRLAHIPAIQPVRNKELRRLASGFGYRIHPILKFRRFHYGLDFSADIGTEVYATGNGKVVKAKQVRGYGRHVEIDHGYGYRTIYAHMSELKVRAGQKIKRGELIGLVGNTGMSTGPHLHYEVIKDGKKVNPINYFTNDLNPAEYEQALILSRQANQSFD